MREMVAQSRLHPSQLIAPLFLHSQANAQEPISTMPGIFRMGAVAAMKDVQELVHLGIKTVAVFPVIPLEWKDKKASKALDKNLFYLQFISEIKNKFPELNVMTDVALDPYSSYGHDGLVDEKSGTILNDETVEVLSQMAILQAQAGCDIVAPSDMMDGRVQAIRDVLEEHKFHDTLIMSYCAKYASAFYGPFRDALGSAPKFGNKKTYQMDPRNSIEALKELSQDELEGADIVMVKPGLAYLDVLFQLKQNTTLPVAVYQVSGEYSMIKAASTLGFGESDLLRDESLHAFRRAGADIIITYFAKEWAQQWNNL
jgi:porphobilinogen synthase